MEITSILGILNSVYDATLGRLKVTASIIDSLPAGTNEIGKVRISDDIKNNGWVVSASADNALAVATKAAETGKSHYITTIIASYSGTKTGLLQLKDGNNVILEHYVVNTDVISLSSPIKITPGSAVSVELEASGTVGVVGKVNLIGFTI
jgi:hypothetical protein